MSSKQSDQTGGNGNDQELREELEGGVIEVAADLVEMYGRDADAALSALRKFASEGREDAQQALQDLGFEQNPEANAGAANAVGGRPDPYARNKSLDERMKKHVAWGPGNDDSPYNDNDDGPSANAAGGAGDVGPSTGGGSFEDFLHSNAAADPTGSENVRDVRLVDDPSNGERVRMIDAREAGDGASTGAERVRIVDLETNAEAAVDADPVYVDNESGSAGTFASFNSQPDTTLLPVNPEKLG